MSLWNVMPEGRKSDLLLYAFEVFGDFRMLGYCGGVLETYHGSLPLKVFVKVRRTARSQFAACKRCWSRGDFIYASVLCERARTTLLGSLSHLRPPPASAHSSPRRLMSSDTVQSLSSNTSLLNPESPAEDWDRSSGDLRSSMQANSVAFPGDGKEEEAVPVAAGGKANRTLSDLLKLHAEKGTNFTCSPEEATRLADVLGQWVSVPQLQFFLSQPNFHPLDEE